MKRFVLFLIFLITTTLLFSCQYINNYSSKTALETSFDSKLDKFLSNTGATPLIEERNMDTLILLYNVNDSIGFFTIKEGIRFPFEASTEITHDSKSEAITVGKISYNNTTYLCIAVNNEDMLLAAYSTKIKISTSNELKVYEKTLNNKKATIISEPNITASDIKIKEVIIYDSNGMELYSKKLTSK